MYFVVQVSLKVTAFAVFLLLALSTQGCSEASSHEDPAEPGRLAFTDVTAEAGLAAFRHETGAFGKKWMPETFGSGGGFVDYDGDGWVDILLVGGGTWQGHGDPVPALELYRNERDGTFTRVTTAAGLADVQAHGYGITAADYDADGDQDVFLTTVFENMLFRNDDGVFTEVGREAGLTAEEAMWSTAALFFDADRDGWLDLYVGNYVEWSVETDIFCTLDGVTKDYCTPQTYTGVPGRYYHNNGDGTFTDRTEADGLLPATGKALGVAMLDYDRDGWMDFLVTNDTEPNQLFANDGDGTFTERGMISGVAYDENGKARAGMGVDVGVVDSTGEVSIFVGHFSREMIGVWRHQSGGFFIDRAGLSQIGRPSLRTLTFGLFLFDVDLDGDLDLYTANGHVNPGIDQISEQLSYAEPAHLFLNEGDGTFVDVVPEIEGTLQEEIVARGAAYADYDRDGDVDILISTNAGRVRLWRNDLEPRPYLRVHAEGRQSNRSALGTRIVAITETHRMERYIAGGASYLSASEQVATFGLGTHTQVDSLIVHWPSGRVDRFTDVAAGQDIRIVEGSASYRPLYTNEEARVAAAHLDR